MKNIKTSYGEFPTLTHFEKYWECKVHQAFLDGIEYKYLKKQIKFKRLK